MILYNIIQYDKSMLQYCDGFVSNNTILNHIFCYDIALFDQIK